jgi:hypothetical protein
VTWRFAFPASATGSKSFSQLLTVGKVGTISNFNMSNPPVSLADQTAMTFTISNAFDLIIFFAGILLLFRKVAAMERHHTLRVFILTAILSCAAIYFFFVYCFTLGNPTQFDCLDYQYCQTEM